MNRLATTALVTVAILALAILAGYVGYRVGDQTGYERAVVAAIAEERWRESDQQSMVFSAFGVSSMANMNQALQAGWRIKAVYPYMEYYDGRPSYQVQLFHLVKD